jgi:hypothetical protein
VVERVIERDEDEEERQKPERVEEHKSGWLCYLFSDSVL